MNYFVTTAIPYVNGEPHLGHALEFVVADVLARQARAEGKTVIFSTGTDEHGGKMAIKAAENNMTPKAFADKMSEQFKELARRLNISHDRFIRTTDPGHKQRAQIIWKNLEPDIYRGKYIGLYCTGCEAFVPEAVAKAHNNVCPHHDKTYERLEEENYFFKLTKYAPSIAQAIDEGSFQIVPAGRKREIQSIIKQGLEDISISRPKEKLAWGVPVPGDASQVMYVWFEALMNYITVLGYPEHQDFKNFWPADTQVIGKDILRFHAAVWPGILLGLGLPLPKSLYVHGFININGKKMSKSLGNYVTPQEIMDVYGPEVLRYFLLRHIPSYEDGDFSWDKLAEAYNSELANELGNAVQRTAAMIERYQNGVIGDVPPAAHDIAWYRQALAEYRFDRALDEVWGQIKGLNQYIDEQKPWQLAKDGDLDHLREVLARQVSDLLEIASLLAPFMPATSLKIRQIFEEGIVRPMEDTLFPRAVAAPGPT